MSSQKLPHEEKYDAVKARFEALSERFGWTPEEREAIQDLMEQSDDAAREAQETYASWDEERAMTLASVAAESGEG